MSWKVGTFYVYIIHLWILHTYVCSNGVYYVCMYTHKDVLWWYVVYYVWVHKRCIVFTNLIPMLPNQACTSLRIGSWTPGYLFEVCLRMHMGMDIMITAVECIHSDLVSRFEELRCDGDTVEGIGEVILAWVSQKSLYIRNVMYVLKAYSLFLSHTHTYTPVW